MFKPCKQAAKTMASSDFDKVDEDSYLPVLPQYILPSYYCHSQGSHRDADVKFQDFFRTFSGILQPKIQDLEGNYN
jgi:hypothetical protein